MPGLGADARKESLETRFGEYETELRNLRRGPTFSQLKQHYVDSGETIDPDSETANWRDINAWFQSKYGGYTPTGVKTELGKRVEPGPEPRFGSSAAGNEASMTGLGETRPWWAKA